MEHIVNLLKLHGLTKQISTLFYMPDEIRNYFGDGSDLGVDMRYAIEDSPLGTAGSVKNAESLLGGETFFVISGDALTDLNIKKAIEYHKKKGATATLILQRVENPLEFGIVIVNEEGRIERFLEKPGWGQVFSDTINTGMYILEPEILDYIPKDTSFDFSQELFPMLLKKGVPLFGYVADCYWCDIGNIDQFMTAQQDVLRGKVNVSIPGIEMENGIWIGNGANVDPEAVIKGPVVIGENSRIEPGTRVEEFSVIGDNVIVSNDSVIQRSVILNNCFIGNSSKVLGALIGERCDLKQGSLIEEGAVLGDECLIGENATVNHHIKIYPFKTVDAGATVSSNIIWESKGAHTLFGKDGITGLINVDITPELAVKLGMAFGTTLPKDAHIICSRDTNRAARIIKRAITSGINSTGVNCRDLQIGSTSLNRFTVRSTRSLGGFHVRSYPNDPQQVQISFFDEAGIDIDEGARRNIEKYFFRGEYRRAFFGEIGNILYQSRNREFYVNEVVRQMDIASIANRHFKIVVDYAYGVTSLMLPSLLGELNCDVIAINPFTSENKTSLSLEEYEESISSLSTAIKTFKADIGFMLDSGGERIFVLDEKGRLLDPQTALMLMVLLVADLNPKKGQIAVPLNASSKVEQIAQSRGCRILRTKVSNSALMKSVLQRDVIFAGDSYGGYIFPKFIPSFDTILSLGKILEYLSQMNKTVSSLVNELPGHYIADIGVYCPWDQKGRVMRKIAESMKDHELVLQDGVKVFEEGQWALVLPDAEEPTVRITAESSNSKSASDLAEKFKLMVTEIVEGRS
jgi:mannose-1-phosphate guanylyltransferase/phosphomannomutase